MIRVLVTGVGGPAGSSLASQLRSRGHFVLGVDMQAPDPQSADAVVQVPAAASTGYLECLQDLVILHGIELVVPTVSDELPLIAAKQDSFGPGVHVLIADFAAVATADDKYATMQRLEAAGVSIPLYGLPSHFASAQDAMARLGGPIVVKPRVSRGGRGVVVIEHTSDVDWNRFTDAQVVQAFAPGTEYAPVVFAAPLPASPAVVVLEKTELKEGRIGNAVSVSRRQGPSVQDVADLAAVTVRAMNLSGPVDIDIRRRSNGTPVVLEVNARFGANSAHAPQLLSAVLSMSSQPAQRAEVL